MLIVLLAPLIPLLLWSVAWRWDFPDLLPQFDLWAWGELGGDKLPSAAFSSLKLSAAVVFLALLLSLPPAKALGCRSFLGKGLIRLLLLIPTFIPQISVVFGMQFVFRRLGIYSTAAGVVLAQLVFQVPYLTLLLSAVFSSRVNDLEQQARCLGTGTLKTWRYVILPAVLPGITVSAVFSFIGSWSNYLLTAVIGPPSLKTLPVLLFPMMSSGNNSYPLIAVFTLVYAAPVFVFLIFSSRLIAGSGLRAQEGGVL
jgi:putative spermidine/putrescine transport system permease protein